MSDKSTNALPLEKLFGSKTRAKLLALFFENPDKSYYVREITRVIEEQINSVRRELTNLNALGLVKIENYENKVYYSANTKHPFCKPLCEMFASKIDSVKEIEVKRNNWEDYARPVESILDAILVTNRLPGQDGIDLLIVGDDATRKLTRWAEIVEKRMGKPINYVILSKSDFIYRKSIHDRFLADIYSLQISDRYDPNNIL
jgi:Fe2+ or Zn2+ uptake regulation protein